MADVFVFLPGSGDAFGAVDLGEEDAHEVGVEDIGEWGGVGAAVVGFDEGTVADEATGVEGECAVVELAGGEVDAEALAGGGGARGSGPRGRRRGCRCG